MDWSNITLSTELVMLKVSLSYQYISILEGMKRYQYLSNGINEVSLPCEILKIGFLHRSRGL